MSELGVGIIGCGNISAAYLDLGPLFSGFEIRAVADINRDAAEARAAEHSIRVETVDGLLGADDIDIIVNLTIPAAHFEVSTAAIESGKNVYSEKPFVLSVEEGIALRQAAAAKGLRVGSAPDTFLGGAHQQARKLIDDGAIGRVVGGTAHVMSRGMEHWHPNPDFFFLPGAGPVLDVGPYYITNLVQLLGPIRRVAALSSSASSTRTISSEARRGEKIPVETPTNIHALLEFETGATITLGASWDVKAHRHGPMELYGTDGSLFLPDPNFFGGKIEMAGEDGTVGTVPAWDHPFGRPNHRLDTDTPQANYRAAGLADMTRAIRDDGPHRCSLDLSLHVVDAMTAILRAGEIGEFVTLRTSCDRPAPLGPDEAEVLQR